jgi:hypothetical protein
MATSIARCAVSVPNSFAIAAALVVGRTPWS